MTDRNMELVPGSWSLVRERALIGPFHNLTDLN